MEFLYALINFALLIGLVVLLGRKAIVGIFSSRSEKINKELDEAESPLPELEEVPKIELPADLSAVSVAEEVASRNESIKNLDAEYKDTARDMRLEMLLATRTKLVAKTMLEALELMQKDKFQQKLSESEDYLADKILSQIKLTAGDRMYLKTKGMLYVTLVSSKPLKEATIEKIKNATDELLASVNGKSSFLIKDNEESLLGGFYLRIGDTLYDVSVRDRMYKLGEALNNMPLEDQDENTMISKMEDAIKNIKVDIDIYQQGRVLTVSDGICWLDGLSDIMYGELVQFVEAKKPMYGMVMDVQPDKIGCIIFGHYDHVDSYSKVRRMGRMATAPVGDELLGRIIDPIGDPIDGKGRIWNFETRPIENPAPAILDRAPVNKPMATGIKAIDALIPIGRGQRELIIGDRQTGKSAVVIDTIINQKDKNVICVYVAIGQKESNVASIARKLEDHGAMGYSIIVCASASDEASIQYIAPFVGTAIAEYFMYKGRDVLIIYDDLSKHAVAYRELSLLLHRPSGREAYPGDIFYLHSRLLERAAKLNDENGGGSITALPIIETQAGDISSYIPTNVISITDGQLFLESELFNAGQRPAINVGLSVSRVGGAAQSKLMKQVAGNLRNTLAQYREFATFMQFGSDIDESTKKVLDSGERMMALLKQNRYETMPTWQQALLIFAVSSGAADNYEPAKMGVFEKEFVSWFRASKPELLSVIMTENKMSDEFKKEMLASFEEFKRVVS